MLRYRDVAVLHIGIGRVACELQRFGREIPVSPRPHPITQFRLRTQFPLRSTIRRQFGPLEDAGLPHISSATNMTRSGRSNTDACFLQLSTTASRGGYRASDRPPRSSPLFGNRTKRIFYAAQEPRICTASCGELFCSLSG